MNDMRKIMESVNLPMEEDDVNPYYAAVNYYLSSSKGETVPQLAKNLSERHGIDYNTALTMIKTIDNCFNHND